MSELKVNKSRQMLPQKLICDCELGVLGNKNKQFLVVFMVHLQQQQQILPWVTNSFTLNISYPVNLGIQGCSQLCFLLRKMMVLKWFYHKKLPLHGIYLLLSPEASHCHFEEYNDRSRGFTTDHGETIQVRYWKKKCLKNDIC